MKKIKCFTDQYFPRLLNHKIIMVLFFFMLNNVSIVLPTQGATLTVNTDNIIGSLTKTAFSTTPDLITDQHQDHYWANSVFQSATAFGGYLRLSVTADLRTDQQQNILKTIKHSKSINREIILLIDFKTISPNDFSDKLSFLKDYFNDNSITWFELGNEVWDKDNSNYYDRVGNSIPDKVNLYAQDIIQYTQKIKIIQPNAKFLISTIEGNSAWVEQSWDATCQWTKEILDYPGVIVDGVSVHLYPSRAFDIPPERLFSLGECVDRDYKTWISHNYFGDNWNKGLIELFKYAINNRSINIFFTEYSETATNYEKDAPLVNTLRNGMHNALVYANTLSYLNKNQVESFGLHQLGKGTGDTPYEKGWNCLNDQDRLIPAALAMKLLSTINGSLISSSLTGSPDFNTAGDALTDTTGSLAPLTNIPYVTAFAARNNNDLYISLTNMSNQPVNVDLKIVGSLNLSNTIFTGKYISAPLTSNPLTSNPLTSNPLTSNNDSGDIDIKDYDKLANGIAILPPYSIVVLHASTPPAPDIKANGQDGQITVSFGTPVSITASLAPGSENGKFADWWLAESTPMGLYTLTSSGWSLGINMLFQYPLVSVPPVEIFKGSLPAGDYAFYFAVDMSPNGVLDSPFYYDFVQVHVLN